MTFFADGRQIEPRGSLLDALLAAGFNLPHLCKDDHLAPIAACRTCLVEADGRIVAACSVPADSVREVTTASERVVGLRRTVLELTAAMVTRAPAQRGPAGDTLNETLHDAGVDGNTFSVRTRAHVDTSNPFFAFTESACILCGRCVVACQALQHISAIGIAGHGASSRVTPDTAMPWGESTCTSCGSCVAACPTHALAPKSGGFP